MSPLVHIAQVVIAMLGNTNACEAAASTYDTDSMIVCATDDQVKAWGMGSEIMGWFDGYSNTVYVSPGLTFQYSRAVIAHELAHAFDLNLGTEVNGYPSYFSETHTGFNVEQYARMKTYVDGDWPEDEVFPDVIPTEADIAAMKKASWL